MSAKRKHTIFLQNEIDYTVGDDLINDKFVKEEIKRSINTVVDSEVKQFYPLYEGSEVKTIVFNVNLIINGVLKNTYLSDFGLERDEVLYKKESFTENYLRFTYYDSDDKRIRRKLGENIIYLDVDIDDYDEAIIPNKVYSNDNSRLLNLIQVNQKSKLKELNEIRLKFKTNSPSFQTFLNNDGYFLYLTQPTNFNSKTIYYVVELTSVKNGFTYLLGNKNGPSEISNILKTMSSPINIYDDLNTRPNYMFSNSNDLNLRYNDGNLIIDFYEITSI